MFTPPTLHNTNRWNGLRIGILGGSFNPPHKGHLHISVAALRGLQLDCVWWLVTPQNPLKQDKPLSLDERLRLSRDITPHPRIIVSDLERQMGTNITYFSIKKMKDYFPKTEFVWISGMDNASTLHKWNHWQRLLEEIPMVHITRPPAKSLVKACPLKQYGRQNHVYIDTSAPYPLTPGTTYWMMQSQMVNISSTEIRQGQKKAI